MNRVKPSRKKPEGASRSIIPCIVFLISAACVILVIQYTGATIAKKQSSAQSSATSRGGGESADVMEEGGAEGEDGGAISFGKRGAAPFLPDFDLSRPVEHGPKGRRLSKEEQEFVSAEAEYQMRLARRNELTGGQRPEPPFPRWKPGKIKEVFLTPTYPCKRAERLGGIKGSEGEGGKWVCNIRKLRADGRRPIVYSIGSAGETSFEDAVRARLRTKAFTFDPFLTDEQAAALRAKHVLRYIPIGLGAAKHLSTLRRGAPGKRFATLAQLMGKLNHSHIDVLKIDCERCEERLMEDLLNTFGKANPPADQILVEIHQIRHVGRTTQVLFPLEDMGYRLFHAEANPRCNTCYELAFVHENFLKPKSMFPAAPDAAAADATTGDDAAAGAAADGSGDAAEAEADAAADAVAAAAADPAADDAAAGDAGAGEESQ